ncbi:Dolichyl-phosphate-mannose-protein mannosyltransferase [Tritrichomonas foetus]|uniref:Dolichyl-phosphate-mannose-protein mannosyltransferase n=1 Tax=Tritrichomonas foetus TaxID=1144522 RepID=A0A1J4J151_9EUKA|nr:Dolichyl-phosphate-mannose-protein mannosyltransferase [Tritrichomonas foetus]|eukprot:OHS93146.1 Dolichyl-phosphate-mannose-protein mannosyltransferase [Tritrichomonas foetus]
MGYPKPHHVSPITTTDCFILVIITFVSLFTRIWKLGYPNDITFDEVYFGNFTNSYIKHEYFVDIHPPLANMIMAYIAYLTQYPGNIDWGKGLSKSYSLDSEINYVSLRLTVMIFSSFCAPFIYLAMRYFNLSYTASLSAASLVGFDFTSIVEGRFILSDGILHFFTCFHIFAFSHFLHNPSHFNVFVVGITLGCAISCKFTALGLIALDGITQIYWIFCDYPSILQILIRTFEIFASCFAVTYCAWATHFIALPYKSEFHFQQSHIINPNPNEKYLNTIIKRSKENVTYLGNRLIKPMVSRIIEFNINTHKNNMRTTFPHPWASNPLYWPLLLDKHVLFLEKEPNILIICMGSPVSYWLSSLGLILTVSSIPLKVIDFRNFVFFSGWAFSYMPFILVARSMYVYHYIVPMIFASLNLATYIENIFKSNNKAAFVNTAIVILSILSYAFFLPWIVGTPCPECKETRLWMSRWINGPPKPFKILGMQAYNYTKVMREDFPI